MAKIEYRTPEKSVFLSHAETVLLLIGELGIGILEAFLPRKYPETRLTRRLLGLDSFPKDRIRLAKHRLIKQGLIAKSGKTCIITPQGKSAADALRKLITSRKPHWDGKWRIVAFDIPERMKKYRAALRHALSSADYQRLQDSVWVGRHPLANEATEFIEECQLGKYIYVFLVSAVDRERDLDHLFSNS